MEVFFFWILIKEREVDIKVLMRYVKELIKSSLFKGIYCGVIYSSKKIGKDFFNV